MSPAIFYQRPFFSGYNRNICWNSKRWEDEKIKREKNWNEKAKE